MRHYEHLQWGPDRMRLAPWRGDPTVAELTPVLAGRPIATDSVRRGLEVAAGRGFRAVVTNALAPEEQHGYVTAGFLVHERLHLLTLDLHTVDTPRPDRRLRRARRGDRAAILSVDASAFDSFWRFDELGLQDSLTATPSRRLRVSGTNRVVAYAVTGCAGPRGYLQRLAVHPEHHRRGWGRALVADAARWLARRGATIVVVNTQESNIAAFELYNSLGFRPRPDGLAVLAYHFEPA